MLSRCGSGDGHCRYHGGACKMTGFYLGKGGLLKQVTVGRRNDVVALCCHIKH